MRTYLLLFLLFLGGCTSVKPYQRVYLNDTNMRPGKSTIGKTDFSAENYREGASGGGVGRTSGGCGCN
jgi:TorA maturation chaperone TorD